MKREPQVMMNVRPSIIAGTLIAATVLTTLAMAGGAVAAGPSSAGSLADNTQRTEAPAAQVDRKLEAAALELVRTHLPELKSVLQRLRADEPRQYNRAIVDLARSAKKLEVAKNRDIALFEIEAETLKSQNSVSLLTAKLKVRDNESDRQLLRQAVNRLQRAQIARAQYDVESLRARLKRTEQQLENAQQRLEVRRKGLGQDLEKSFIAALKKAGRQPVSDSSRRPIPDPPVPKSPVGEKKKLD